MKYLVVIIGGCWLFGVELYYLIPVWAILILTLYSHKRAEEYKILERKDGFGTTYIPVLVQHNKLFWWKWDRYGFVHQEFIDENPDTHTYFGGAKRVIEVYKEYLIKKAKPVKIEEHEC